MLGHLGRLFRAPAQNPQGRDICSKGCSARNSCLGQAGGGGGDPKEGSAPQGHFSDLFAISLVLSFSLKNQTLFFN